MRSGYSVRATEPIAGILGPLRLVVVTHYFPEHRGGIELVAAALVGELTEGGRAVVEWFASDCDAPPAGVGLTPRPIPAWNGVEAHTGLPYPLWSPTTWPSLWCAIRRCDLVHIHDYVYMGSLLAWIMAKLVRRPCVITQHVGNVPLGSRLARLLLRVTNATIGRLVLRSSAAAVFVSDIVRRQFFDIDRERVRVIANGVDTLIFHPLDVADRSVLRGRLGFAEERPVLLFVGRFVDKKGLPLLQELVPRLPHVQWIFAGRGPLDPGTWNQPAVRIFRDRVGSTLAELYQAADLLVLPSVGEGFPLVVQEAMACGTPVLAGGELVGALPDVDRVLMTENVQGADAVDRWQANLTSLLADFGGLKGRRQTTAEFAAERWSWNRCADAYLDLYRKAMNQ
jgi:glycosyltransferase involved in cell wall biosynthesis